MNTRTTSLLMVLALLGWAAPAAAQSPDFTFTVPVELHSVEASHGGFLVRCEIGMPGGTVPVYGITEVIPLDGDGDYTQGPVTVTITLSSNFQSIRPLVNSYSCFLVWEDTGQIAQADQAKPDTPVDVRVGGGITQGG